METTKQESRPGTGIYLRRALVVLLISLSIVIADQLVKALILRTIPEGTIGVRLWNDFLWIVHSRNLGIALSIGDGLSKLMRVGFFIVLPSIFLIIAFVFCISSESLGSFLRISIAILAGGGLGNLIDRIFRPDGVIDFLSFSLFGIFGLDRFPTFNIADLCVTVGAGLVLLSGFVLDKGGLHGERN